MEVECLHCSLTRLLCEYCRVQERLKYCEPSDGSINVLSFLSFRWNVRAAIQATWECSLHLYQMHWTTPGWVEDSAREGTSGLRSPHPHCTSQLPHIISPVALQTGSILALLLFFFCAFTIDSAICSDYAMLRTAFNSISIKYEIVLI